MKFWNEITNTIFALALFLSSCSSYYPKRDIASEFAPAANCQEMLVDVLEFNIVKMAKDLVPTKRYPKGFRKTGKNHLQYGFESEYSLDQIEGILKFYSPERNLISKTDWESLSSAQKSNWVKDHINELFPNDRTEGGLVLTKRGKEFEFLPKRLIRDETGNIEIVLPPYDTLEEWYKAVTIINKNFGEGSMQATVSVPRKAFFLEESEATETFKRNIGFLSFYSDYDAIEKLTLGYERWLESNEKRVARSFEHPFLGPMNKQKYNKLKQYLRANADGEMYDEQAKEFVSGSDASFKYFGGTAYRPDIASPDRVVVEVRDAHNKFNLLFNKVLRNTHHLMNDRSEFSAFSKLKPFDADKTFETLPKYVQNGLKQVFPNRAKPGIDYTKDELSSLEVAKNFSWPLRDWSQHFQIISNKDLEQTVSEAQARYLERLKQITRGLRGDADKEKAAVEIQGALVTFVEESGLRTAFLDIEERIIAKTSSGKEDFSKLIKQVSITSGPIKNFFPSKMKTGSPQARMKEFASLYPLNVKVIEEVTFELESKKAKKSLLVISLNNLSEEVKQKLLKDYYEYFSYDTVSFPLGESGGHLYSRVGKKTLDYIGSVTPNDYRFPSSERLESFLFLTPEEHLNLRTYIDNGIKDSNELLGDFDYDGSGQLATNATLTNNRLRTNDSYRGHNCTSWICTAPIGQKKKTMYELAGATKRNDVHTNPGWWSNWLTAVTGQERSPFAVYMTNEPLKDALSQRLNTKKVFNWDFDRH
ncbi:MAG: hypothetical protein Fur0010_04460 [Bdellovibrio sp.]